MKAFDRETMERIRDNIGLLIAQRDGQKKDLGAGAIGERLIGGDANGAMGDAIRLAGIRGELVGLKSVMSMLWEDIHGDDCAEQDGKPKRTASRVELTPEEVSEIGAQARISYAEAIKHVEETARRLDEISRKKFGETMKKKRWWDQ